MRIARGIAVTGALVLALSAPAAAQAPSLEAEVARHDQMLNSLGAWMEDCISRTTLKPAGRAWSKRRHRYVPVYSLVMTRDQIHDCIADHKPWS